MEYIEHASAVASLASAKILAQGILAQAKLMDNLIIGCQVLEKCLEQSGEIEADDFMENIAEGDLALSTIVTLAKKTLEDLRAIHDLCKH